MSDSAHIVGAAETPYVRRADGETTLSLLATVVQGVLRDADLDPVEVDGLAISSFSLVPDHAVDVAWRLGLRLRWLMEDTNGGASGLNMLQHARRAVEAGDASVVVVAAGDVFAAEGFRELVDSYNSATRDHLAGIPFGGPTSLFALLTQRHMRACGLGRETYGRLVLSQRAWASQNPNAVYRTPLTLDEYLNAPLVADPLVRYDCVPIVSGANAVVVVGADRVRHKRSVSVGALASSVNADDQQGDGLQTGLAAVAGQLWEESGVGPHDVHVASVYDDYPAVVLVQLDDLGFVPDHDVDRFVRARIASRALPLNTSGGQLSAGQAGAAGGLHGLVEVVRQLRGDAAARQVPGAEVGLVTGYGMVAYRYGACANAAILRRLR